jgi:hypothetical protein
MGNGEWGMENGEWGMENGGWRMEDGEWRMDGLRPLRETEKLSIKVDIPREEMSDGPQVSSF